MGTHPRPTANAARTLALLLALLLGLGYAWISVLRDDAATPGAGTNPAPTVETAATPEDQVESGVPRSTASGRSAAATLAGRVVDAAGRGLNGIGLRLHALQRDDRSGWLREVETGADGAFLLERLEPAREYTLTTLATDEYPAYRLQDFRLGDLPQPIEIRLARLDAVIVEGTVVDADHAPLAGFTLTVASLDSQVPPRTVASDASGSFRIDDFPAGGLRIYSAAPDTFRIQGLRAERDRYRNLTLVVDRGRYSLAGRVVAPSGAPVPDARVTLNSVIAAAEYHSHAYRSRSTDAYGRFRFENLGGGAQVLGVYANGFRSHIENHVFQSFADEVVISLQP